jgi:rfaE bifunctional protein kinase chain/domain
MSRKDLPSADDLVRRIDRFAGRRVAMLVDLVVDEFVCGDIERISREAPVLILRHRTTEIVPGGGGNAAANLAALGARPVPVGVVGRDEAGDRLVERFRELGIPVGSIVRARDYATPCKSRVIAGGMHTRRQQVVRLDRGGPDAGPSTSGTLSADTRRRVIARLRAVLPKAEGLLVADYGYGAATPDLLRRGGGKRLSSLPVMLDSRARVARFEDVTACTPNQEELERALDESPLRGRKAVEAGGARLLRRCRSEALLLTRGPQGMCLFERRRRPVHIPPFGSDEVADVTGAGDTVIATFTLARLAGASFEESARLANYAAGLVVLKAGTATVGRDELVAAVREDLGS